MILIYHTPGVTARTSSYAQGWQFILIYAHIGSYRYSHVNTGGPRASDLLRRSRTLSWPKWISQEISRSPRIVISSLGKTSWGLRYHDNDASFRNW